MIKRIENELEKEEEMLGQSLFFSSAYRRRKRR
jgi:hypothetical protein